MRRFILSVVVMAAYGSVATAQSCMRPEDRQAFDVVALKSALMVGALSCNEGEQYDSFMTTYQAHILDEQHVIDAYFRHAGGLAGQAQEDAFVTSLANNQSAAAIAAGAPFCQTSAGLFTKVAALQAAGDLDSFALAMPLPQPISMTSCGVIDHHLHHRRASAPVTLADNQ